MTVQTLAKENALGYPPNPAKHIRMATHPQSWSKN